MAHRTIGVYWDDSHIQVAVVQAGFRRFSVVRVLFLQREEEKGVAQTLKDNGIEISASDTVVTSFPGNRVMYNEVTFPFREPRRIAEALPFQIAESVPFDISEMLVDYHVAAEVGRGVKIISAAVPRAAMTEYLETARQNGIDPEVVVPGGLELAVLGPYLELQRAIVVLRNRDLLELAYLEEGNLHKVRSVQVPGDGYGPEVMRELTLFIAGVENERGDVEQVFLIGANPEEARDVSGALGIDCDVLLADELGLPMEVVEEPPKGSMKALLLALLPEVLPSKVYANLRKGEFASAARFSILREKIRLIGITAAIFFVLLGVKGYLHYRILKAQETAVQAQVEDLSKRLLGKAYEDPDRVLAKMRRQLSYKLEVLPRCPVARVMSDIFELIQGAGMASEDVVPIGADQGRPYAMEVESIRVDESGGYVRCQADTIETMERFIEKLKNNPCLNNVVTESTERISFRRHEGWQRFSVRFSVVQTQSKTRESK